MAIGNPLMKDTYKPSMKKMWAEAKMTDVKGYVPKNVTAHTHPGEPVKTTDYKKKSK